MTLVKFSYKYLCRVLYIGIESYLLRLYFLLSKKGIAE